MSLRARNAAPTLLGAMKGGFDVFSGDIETLKGRDIYCIVRKVSSVYRHTMKIKYDKAKVRENVLKSENV